MSDEQQAVETATPEEHAEATGNVTEYRSRRTINGSPTLGKTFSAPHMAAAQLHGWAAHSLHTVEKLQITRAAYLAALEAASSGGEPHAEAVSQYAPKTQPRDEAKPVPARRKVQVRR